MSEVKRVEVRRGNLLIRGTVYGDTSLKRPVCILSHGFLANQKSVKSYAKLLAQKGYIAVSFDFNGGGLGSKSTGKSEDMTVFTELEDLLAVIGYMRKQYYTESISLLGCSQGGLVSAMAAAKLKTEIRSLVLFYPALCIPADAGKGRMLFYRFDPEKIPDLLGRFPMKLGGAYARSVLGLDPKELIRGYEGPVLFLHGTKDAVVDISYAREVYPVYPRCAYRELEGAGHGFTGSHQTEAFRYLTHFAEKFFCE